MNIAITTLGTPDDMQITAERLLSGIRDEPIETTAGAVAVTATIGGTTAPRYGRSARDILARYGYATP